MQILDQKFVKTRTFHQCCGCLVTFPTGTTMHVQKILDEGSVYSWYECEECRYLVQIIYDQGYTRTDEGYRRELCGYDNEELKDACLCSSCKPKFKAVQIIPDEGSILQLKTQLRIRTEFSFGKTYASIDKVIKRLKEIGCKSAGIVDESTWGHVAWFKACKKADIQPLLGVEICVSDNDIPLKMWFLARTAEGLQKLYRARSKACNQSIGSIPRLYQTDVMFGLKGDDIFIFAGDVTDRAFLSEVGAFIDFNPSSRVLNHKKKSMADEFGFTTVYTSDNSFVNEEDAEIFEMISKSSLKTTPQYILSELTDYVNSDRIASMCSKLELPKAPMLKAEGDLEYLCHEGTTNRFGSKWSDPYEARFKYEIELIRSKNFESYFIIVADMTRYAKQHMLVGPSRGSAAGSLVCYLLGITEVDPIPAGLYFERFIDINRTDLPDIDLDFPDNKRQMIFDYMTEKYGVDNVAHIGTISKYRAKSALIDICKALNIPPSETVDVKTAIIERMPGDADFNYCLRDTFQETEAGRDFIKDNPKAIVAASIEGHARHTGVHAAGLLVCDDAIGNYATVDAKGITHVEKGAAEDLGLLKIDILGLRTLTVLEDAGIDIDWYNLKFDDPAVFEIFNSGRLCGIFQFEGRAMRNVSRDVTFKTIEDISIVTALARPGPLQSGIDKKFIKRMNAETKPKSLIPALDETYGLPIYQEQTMAIVREIGGFDWADTIAIRKLVSKSKGKEAIDAYREKFMAGVDKLIISESQALALWEMIIEMGSYQMNKAHTYSYAVISYWAAYLKAHHPIEFLASNLRHAKDDESAIALLREMKQEGFDYIPFSLEHSEVNWSVQNDILYGGFTALKGVGKIKATKYIEHRKNGTLTEAMLTTIAKAKNCFGDIFPFHANYQYIYDDPDANEIASEIHEISELNTGKVPHHQERVFLCELVEKSLRNENEAARVKKRGEKMTGQTDFVNVKLRDDSGEIGGKIGRFEYEKWGKMMLKDIPIGSHLVVRAVFYNGIPWAFIKKFRRIDV